ncbi:hypothetical protein ISX56_31630, partial [Serratia ureilytica]|nr:hypothetical protein [Serratia ureilytica]
MQAWADVANVTFTEAASNRYHHRRSTITIRVFHPALPNGSHRRRS